MIKSEHPHRCPTVAPLCPLASAAAPPSGGCQFAARLKAIAGGVAVPCRPFAWFAGGRCRPTVAARAGVGWGGVGLTCRPVAVPLVIMRGPMPPPVPCRPVPADGVGIGKPRRPYKGKPRRPPGQPRRPSAVRLSAQKHRPFLYVKLFAFAVDRLPAVPFSFRAILIPPMRTLIDLITAAAIVALAWLAAVAILSL